MTSTLHLDTLAFLRRCTVIEEGNGYALQIIAERLLKQWREQELAALQTELRLGDDEQEQHGRMRT